MELRTNGGIHVFSVHAGALEAFLSFFSNPLLVAQFPRQEIRDQAPRLVGESRVVAVAVGHGKAVPRAMEEVPVQGLAVGLKACH